MVKISRRSGFTLLEVSLFLALSGFLMVGLIVSANISVARQRYADSVQSFGDFLKGVYSDTINVSNDKTPSSETGGENAGRSKTAIYGKLLVFGEETGETDSSGNAIPSTAVHSYDVVGNAVTSSSITASNTIDILKAVEANIVYDENAGQIGASKKYVAFRETSFSPSWEADLENPNGTQFRGMILIVRSPTSGTVHTYLSELNPPAIELALRDNPSIDTTKNLFVNSVLENANLTERQIDICVDSDDLRDNENRRDVRITSYAANSSGVILVEQDEIYDASSNPNGSLCGGKGI